jgi:CBS domain-containing protein
MTAADIMAKSPAVTTPDTPLPEIARMMVEHDCGAIPVVDSREDPRPIGIVTDRDIVVRVLAEGNCPLEAKVRDAMTEGVATIGPEMNLEQIAAVMERNQVRRVPVVDANGKVIGIVSQADVALNAPPQETAEMVREISEEEDLTEKSAMGGAYSS